MLMLFLIPSGDGVRDTRAGVNWTVTFTSMPGAYPAGSGDVAALVPDATALAGNGRVLSVTAGRQS